MSLIDPNVMIASSASAFVSRLTTHPLDTLRVRVQTFPGKTMPPLREIIPKPITGLYAGLPVALAFNVPGSCFYLTAYEAAKNGLSPYLVSQTPDGKPPTLLAQFPLIVASALTAEIASGLIWTPMDVLKQRLQTGRESTKSAPTLIKQIWKEEGYRGVWRGYWFGLAQFGPYVSIYWTLYEAFKTRFIPDYIASQNPKQSKTPQHDFFSTTTLKYTGCSMAACGITTVAINPIDIVQTRWQTSGGKLTVDGAKSSKEGTIKDIVKHMWQQGGPKSFMRGTGLKICYSVPANAIGMTTYETMKRWGAARQARKEEKDVKSSN